MKVSKVEELLNSLTKEEIISIFKYLINEYEGLEEKILFKYVTLEEDEEIKKNKKYLLDINRKYGVGRKLISWRDGSKYSEEVFDIVDNAKGYYLDTKKPLVAVETSIFVITKMIFAIQYIDDSGGDIGWVVSQALQLLDETCMDSDEFSQEDKRKIFNKLLNQADKSVYDGWEDWRLEVISNCIYFCEDKKMRSKFIKKIDEMLENYSDDWSGRYSKEKILVIKLQIISTYSSDKEEEEFIESNIKYSGFRELLIKRAIENNEYNRVLKLSEEGELQDNEYRGLVHKWKKYKYEAFKNLAMDDKQKELAKELFMSGDMSFYKELKDIYIDHWEDYYLELKKELKEKKLYTLNIYSEMLIEEKDLEELLEFCRDDVRRIELYDELLVKDYKEEVNSMYKLLIERISERANDRKQYKSVCKVIKKYKKLAGDIETYKIVSELKNEYKRKPAFIDELGKV